MGRTIRRGCALDADAGGPPVNQPPARTMTTFVLRFWREPAAMEAHWRGSIEHVQSGEMMNFRDLDRMLAFIQKFGIDTGQAQLRKEDI